MKKKELIWILLNPDLKKINITAQVTELVNIVLFNFLKRNTGSQVLETANFIYLIISQFVKNNYTFKKIEKKNVGFYN